MFEDLAKALGLPQGFFGQSPVSPLQTLNPQVPNQQQAALSAQRMDQTPPLPAMGQGIPPQLFPGGSQGPGTFSPAWGGTSAPPLPPQMTSSGPGGFAGAGNLPLPLLMQLMGLVGTGPNGVNPSVPGIGLPPGVLGQMPPQMGGMGGGFGQVNPTQLLGGITGLPLGNLTQAIPQPPPLPPMPPGMPPPGMGPRRPGAPPPPRR